jgi:signal transduction histidine kinase
MAIRGYARGTSIFRVKIYSHGGETLYSTDRKQVGLVNPLNKGVTAAIAGEVFSQLLHRDTFNTFDREATDIDMVQSYIPGVRIGPGTDRLVFEVYSDVTGELADLRADQHRIFIILGLALHALVWRARSLLEQRSIEPDLAYQHIGEAALELAQRKGGFVAAVAHELRTPMTTIRGFSELLRDRPMDQQQLRDLADAINQQAEGMSQLLDELLVLSQFDEQGKAAMRFWLQPLAPLVQSVVDNAKSLGLPRSDMQVDAPPACLS